MAIYFDTQTPKKLLAAYKKAIDDGHVTTWAYDEDGDFTHTADQWNKKAWLRPKFKESNALIFTIVKPKESTLSSAIFTPFITDASSNPC
ncbi:hypothetical protein ACVWW2_008510 [Bradyrhizobium sp. LM4.3]